MPTESGEQPGVPAADPSPAGHRTDATPAGPDADATRDGAFIEATPDGPAPDATPATAEEHDGSRGRIPLDLVGGLVLLAIVAVFLVNAGDDPLDWVFPRTLSYVLAIIGGYLTIRGLLRFGDKTDTLLPILRGRGVDVFVFTGLAVLYVLLVRLVGFWTMTAATLFAGALYLDTERSRKRVVIAAVVALAVCVVAYLLLVRVFYIPVPPERWLPS